MNVLATRRSLVTRASTAARTWLLEFFIRAAERRNATLHAQIAKNNAELVREIDANDADIERMRAAIRRLP